MLFSPVVLKLCEFFGYVRVVSRAKKIKITTSARCVKLSYRPPLPLSESCGCGLAAFVPVKKDGEQNLKP